MEHTAALALESSSTAVHTGIYATVFSGEVRVTYYPVSLSIPRNSNPSFGANFGATTHIIIASTHSRFSQNLAPPL
jgi:hypothetical protein